MEKPVQRKPDNKNGRDRDGALDLDALLHPAQAFARPADVVNDRDLTLSVIAGHHLDQPLETFEAHGRGVAEMHEHRQVRRAVGRLDQPDRRGPQALGARCDQFTTKSRTIPWSTCGLPSFASGTKQSNT